MKGWLYIIITLMLFQTSCSNKRDCSLEEQIQDVLDRTILKYNERGVSTAIIIQDSIKFSMVSGISHDSVSMKPDMLFAIGSVTKNFVAALTLKLVEENKLSLDDPLSRWLPTYPNVNSTITIRQLLNHTSGIYMFWDNQKIWDELKKDRGKVWTPEEVLGYIKDPYFAPGKGWRYSNTNYLLLAMIIEKSTGSTLSTELKKHLFEPLGIENIYLSQEDTIPENQAHVFGDNFNFGDPTVDLTFLPRASHESITFGSSGVFTTAMDLATWSTALYEGKVLQAQSMAEMSQFVKFKPFGDMKAYGLGVQVYRNSFSSGKLAIGHAGGNIGTTTYMVYLPDYQVSIVVMVNAFPGKSATAITKKLIRVILKDQNALGFIPSIAYPPTGIILFVFALSILTITVVLIRKRNSLKTV